MNQPCCCPGHTNPILLAMHLNQSIQIKLYKLSHTMNKRVDNQRKQLDMMKKRTAYKKTTDLARSIYF